MTTGIRWRMGLTDASTTALSTLCLRVEAHRVRLLNASPSVVMAVSWATSGTRAAVMTATLSMRMGAHQPVWLKLGFNVLVCLLNAISYAEMEKLTKTKLVILAVLRAMVALLTAL